MKKIFINTCFGFMFLIATAQSQAATIKKSFEACNKAVGPSVSLENVDPGRAQYSCERAIEEDPENPDLWAYLSRAHYRYKEYEKAFKWATRAAKQGNVHGQMMLGMLYRYGFGKGDKRDEAKSLKWYRLAAEQGNIKAQITLGESYRDGSWGLEKSYTESLKWYRLAAKQGSSIALFNVADFNKRGLGLVKSKSKGLLIEQQAKKRLAEEAREKSIRNRKTPEEQDVAFRRRNFSKLDQFNVDKLKMFYEGNDTKLGKEFNWSRKTSGRFIASFIYDYSTFCNVGTEVLTVTTPGYTKYSDTFGRGASIIYSTTDHVKEKIRKFSVPSGFKQLFLDTQIDRNIGRWYKPFIIISGGCKGYAVKKIVNNMRTFYFSDKRFVR